MKITTIVHNSADYAQMLHLRKQVLLAPIGIPDSYIQKEAEAADILVGAFDQTELVGCCILSPKENQTVQLRQMAVALPYQGKGIGKALLYFAEAAAQLQHYSMVMMHARNAVIPFYQKCGYTIVGTEFKEVGIAHHKMQKSF